MSDNIKLLIDGQAGIYVPQVFAEIFDVTKWGLTYDNEDIKILLDGPGNGNYDEAWEFVLKDAKHIDKNGIEWTLHQDGDLFMVAYYCMSKEERINFFGNF